MAIVALLDLEFAQDCRRWWGAINQHMREHGICWSYNRSRGTISVVLQPDDPNWAGVDPAIVGELAVLVLRERGQTGQTDFMRSYVRPTLHRVHWPRLAKSLGLET